MLNKRQFVWCFGLLLFYNLSYAKDYLDTTIGKDSFYYVFWHIYDIELSSQNGTFSFAKPFKLKLTYKTNIKGEEIANNSIDLIKQLGFKQKNKLNNWQDAMIEIFPNIKDGDSLTGIYNPDNGTSFLYNQQPIGNIQDLEFGRWFFGIWLDQKTSEPELRNALLGLKK